MAFSDVFIYKDNQDIDYNSESVNQIQCARKFTVFVYFTSTAENLIKYLIDSYLLISQCFRLCVLVNGREIDIKRFRKIFTNIAIIQFLQKQKEYKMLECILELTESDYFIFITDDFKIKKIDFVKLDNLFLSYKNPLCIAPLIFDEEYNHFPLIRIPCISQDGGIEINSLPVTHRLENTLYPISLTGVYSKKNMKAVGKFIDSKVYPSVVDYFIRAYMLAYSCVVYDEFCVLCTDCNKLIEQKLNRADMLKVNLNAFSFKKQGDAYAKTNFVSLFSYSLKDIRNANRVKDNYLFDYATIVKNWRLSEDEAIYALKELEGSRR